MGINKLIKCFSGECQPKWRPVAGIGRGGVGGNLNSHYYKCVNCGDYVCRVSEMPVSKEGESISFFNEVDSFNSNEKPNNQNTSP